MPTIPSAAPVEHAAPYVEVRPEASSRPFASTGRVYLAAVRGDRLAAFDIRDGDQLVLVRRKRAEHGDFAVLPLSAVRFPYGMQNRYGRGSRADDPLTLWKVYPESNRLRLSSGPRAPDATSNHGETSAPVDAPILGVLVGILRRPR